MTDRHAAISQRTAEFLAELPRHVSLVAAAKTRSSEEIRAAIDGGVTLIGHNYVQEATAAIDALHSQFDVPIHRGTQGSAKQPVGLPISLVMIGHLQRNKVKQAVRLFDAIQTVDSLRLARAIDAECARIGRVMPILIEVNSAREPQKAGVVPDEAEDLIRELADLPNLRIEGLMTMGPLVDDPEQLRPLFAETKALFDRIAASEIPNVSMTTLSMGMSDSYRAAIEEGATMIRLGTLLFGPRG